MPTLNAHGDIHIPDSLIHAMGLKPGMELSVERQGDAIVMRPVAPQKPSRVEDGPNVLGYQGATVSLEEMDDAIAKGAKQSL
ncbi:MAG: AbrB/MazE/SpoVT family DNA-binding domain-containing protein [Gammaproteobacteria bacterium]